MASPPASLPLRIVLVAPPPGVTWALQLGRDELVPPASVAPDRVVLEASVTLGPDRADGAPTLRGAAAQGPPAARFVYANSGTSAGQAGSPWTRRMKVPLGGITRALVDACLASPGSVLEARVAGTARDGGPACATVPLLDGGWRVVTASGTARGTARGGHG